jgi:hypothetical protein
MTYKDFDLLIERTANGFQAQVLDSPAGQASVEFTLPFSDLEVENYLLRLGRPRRLVRRIESADMQTAKNFGAALFNAVFDGDVRACLRSSVDETKRDGTGVRLRLRLADASLADLPWELLYNPAVNRFLALSVQTPLVRYVELPERIQPISVTPPIRVLVMLSSPTDFPALDVEGEWNKLTDALKDLLASGQIAIDRLDNATLGTLQRRLRKAKYHIFHFIGHGEFDQAMQEGVLLLEGENQRGHRVGSQYLGMLLHDHESLRVAILNACEGARSSRQDPFAGSAQSLVQQGIPAVIAMQFEIADDVAGTFAHEFYGALADGYPIDAALTEARKAIFAGGHEVEWATPVLYLRAPDGRIFDVDRQAPRAAPATLVVEPPHAIDQEPPTPQQRAAALLRSADFALASGEFEEALQKLHEARAYDPNATALAELTTKAEEQRAVAETRARRRAAFQEHVAAAADLLAHGDASAALARVSEAVRLRPDDAEARALQLRVREAFDRPQERRDPVPAARPPDSPTPLRPSDQVRGKVTDGYESDLLDPD